jgi:hypothetical protein
MDYVLPTVEPSVITGRHLDASAMPLPLPQPVAAVLHAQVPPVRRAPSSATASSDMDLHRLGA